MVASFLVIEPFDLLHKTLSETKIHTQLSRIYSTACELHERVLLLHLGPEWLRPQKQHHNNHCERQRLVLCSKFSITQQNIRVTLTQ